MFTFKPAVPRIYTHKLEYVLNGVSCVKYGYSENNLAKYAEWVLKLSPREYVITDVSPDDE